MGKEVYMPIWIQILVCLVAGMGAGLGTGFAGMSAAAVIAPMLTTFLKMDAYDAVGIALASDVLASGASALTYKKHGNIDVRDGSLMMATVLLFTMIGSWASSLLPSATMGSFSVVMTALLGIRFIVRPVMTTKEIMQGSAGTKRMVLSALSGCAVGFICGFVGAGGGIMMLIVLTTVLGFELKTAVGTSVFIMTFTALTGSVSHFILEGMPAIFPLVLCVVFTLIFARIGARIANKIPAKTLNRTTGILLLTLGVIIITVNALNK